MVQPESPSPASPLLDDDEPLPLDDELDPPDELDDELLDELPLLEPLLEDDELPLDEPELEPPDELLLDSEPPSDASRASATAVSVPRPASTAASTITTVIVPVSGRSPPSAPSVISVVPPPSVPSDSVASVNGAPPHPASKVTSTSKMIGFMATCTSCISSVPILRRRSSLRCRLPATADVGTLPRR